MQQPTQTPRFQLTRHQIPTHLNVPDKILSFWGVGITVRQLLILLIGWSLMANVWVSLAWLAAFGTPGGALHFALAAIPALIALVVAFKVIAGRPLEEWALVLLRYWQQPEVCVWRSVRIERAADAAAEEDERQGQEEEAGGDVGEGGL